MKMAPLIETTEVSSRNDTDEMLLYGIRKVSIEYFYYGMYGYLDVKDAIAQARRDQKEGMNRN